MAMGDFSSSPPPPSPPPPAASSSACAVSVTAFPSEAPPIPRGNTATLSVTARKFIGCAFLLFNALYGFVLFVFHAPFALLVHQLAPFFAAYALSLLFALFSLRLQLSLLLLPLLITTVPFVVLPLLIIALYLSDHFCLFIPPLFAASPNISVSPSFLSSADCPSLRPFTNSSPSPFPQILPKSVMITFFLAFLFVEKSVEFLFFLNLKRLFLRIANQQKFKEENFMGKNWKKAAKEKKQQKERGEKQNSRGRKRKSIARQNIVEEQMEEDRAEEEMVYGKELHRSQPKAVSPMPIVCSSKRVIA